MARTSSGQAKSGLKDGHTNTVPQKWQLDCDDTKHAGHKVLLSIKFYNKLKKNSFFLSNDYIYSLALLVIYKSCKH